MKIGILTFHDGINHGGFFQAYSTYSFLKNKGYSVEIINYKNKTHWKSEYKNFLFTKNPIKLIRNIKKILKFKKAHKKMNLKSLKKRACLIDDSFDVVIVGSDIVWNYEWEFLGKDQIYFGFGIKTKRWISYAPSFGSINCTNTKIPSYVIEGLEKFSHISVRDENSQCIVRKAINRETNIVLDPTFLIDSSGMETNIDISEEFLLVYAYIQNENDVYEIKEFANSRKLKIVAIGYSMKEADFNIVSLGPFEWLSYFKKANFVVTGTFHGTIFSIKYKKEFITIANENINNKTRTMLDSLGLKNRLVNNFLSKEVTKYKPIDYKAVDKLLIPKIEESSNYLIEALDNDK